MRRGIVEQKPTGHPHREFFDHEHRIGGNRR
jgi:hypothetical protein